MIFHHSVAQKVAFVLLSRVAVLNIVLRSITSLFRIFPEIIVL